MRYDGESGKIKIGLSELVAIARRGISPTLPYDEDEPMILETTARRLSRILPDLTTDRLVYGFNDGEHDYELTTDILSYDGESLTLAREIEGNPEKPPKEVTAQVRGEGFVTAYALCDMYGTESLTLRYVYLGIGGDHAITSETVSAKKLKSFFNKCLSVLKKYALPEVERVTKRLPTLRELRFPYKNIRDGQDEFIRRAYRTLARGGVLYASAPTGTGKTISALYPALRALGDGKYEKIFYLTPKSTTAEAVRDCLAVMEEGGAIVRAIVLTAKEKACCENMVCRESRKACRLSVSGGLADAALSLYELGRTVVTRDILLDVSQKHGVCPYELSLAYAEICDVVVCDFNHLFDPRVYIKRFFTHGGKYAFLIDEAHNLVERAREIYSAEISEEEICEPSTYEVLGEFSAIKRISGEACQVFRDTLFPYLKDELREGRDGEIVGATNLSSAPDRLYSLFDELLEICDDELTHNLRSKDDERDARVKALRNYYYKIKKFSDTLARFDSSYKMFLFYEDGRIRAKLYCLDASPRIRERLDLGHGAVLFSATLSPLNYYRSVLGGERSDEMLEVASPFDPSQLSVTIMDKVSTRYSEREDTLGAVCRVIAATVSAKRGNYMIFSPSFAYSEALAKSFAAKYPKIRIMSQTKDMSARKKAEFLDEFRKNDSSYLIAFCVMGGIYSEGVDLAGDSLIGAVVVGVGIPSLSYEREAVAEYYDEKYEMGKQYAYIYPGMNRVFQAAGRVIRREDDRGVIVLIDDRFDDPIYKKSLPDLWRGVKFIGDAKRLREILDEFWREEP